MVKTLPSYSFDKSKMVKTSIYIYFVKYILQRLIVQIQNNEFQPKTLEYMNMKARMNKSSVKIFLAYKNSTCTYHMKEM